MAWLAQLQNVDSGHIKDVLLILMSFLAAASAAVNIRNSTRTQKREISFSDSYVTKDLCSSNHGEIMRRVGVLEGKSTEVWNTMRKEDEATRQELRKCFQDIERSLGRIEGELRAQKGES